MAARDMEDGKACVCFCLLALTLAGKLICPVTEASFAGIRTYALEFQCRLKTSRFLRTLQNSYTRESAQTSSTEQGLNNYTLGLSTGR